MSNIAFVDTSLPHGPAHRDLTGFAFDQTKVDEALVRDLHRMKFLESAHSLVLMGGPGTGQTHLATSLGMEAIRVHGKRVRFFSTVELVNAHWTANMQPSGASGRWTTALGCPSGMALLARQADVFDCNQLAQRLFNDAASLPGCVLQRKVQGDILLVAAGALRAVPLEAAQIHDQVY